MRRERAPQDAVVRGRAAGPVEAQAHLEDDRRRVEVRHGPGDGRRADGRLARVERLVLPPVERPRRVVVDADAVVQPLHLAQRDGAGRHAAADHDALHDRRVLVRVHVEIAVALQSGAERRGQRGHVRGHVGAGAVEAVGAEQHFRGDDVEGAALVRRRELRRRRHEELLDMALADRAGLLVLRAAAPGHRAQRAAALRCVLRLRHGSSASLRHGSAAAKMGQTIALAVGNLNVSMMQSCCRARSLPTPDHGTRSMH